MKFRLLLAGLFAMLIFNSVARAETTPLPGGPRLTDCSNARDPARCEARLQARHACAQKRGDAKRNCMDAYVVAPDCAHSDNPKQCVARKKAEQACRGKQGKTYKACLQREIKKNRAKKK